MRHLLLVPLMVLLSCGAADKTMKDPETSSILVPEQRALEGRALHEEACDRALELLAAAPEFMAGYSLAELRMECLNELASLPPAEARRRARCYVASGDFMQLVACEDPMMADPNPRDSLAAVVPSVLPAPGTVDPLVWRVCVHLADIAMVEVAAQLDQGQVTQVKDMAVAACVDALKDVPQHELEMVSDCLLNASTIDDMKGCNLPDK